MGAKTIKGITVKIDGKATGLSKVLKEVSVESIRLNKELKQVNKALKLDPSNATLLAEKQKILTESVAAARKELEQLEKAQEQVEKQYASGEIDRGAYLEFQTKLEAARANLARLEEQQRSFGSTTDQVVDKAGRRVDELCGKISALGDKVSGVGEKVSAAGDKISSVGNGLTKGVTTPIMAAGSAAVAAFSAVDEGTDTIIKATGATGDALESLQDSYEAVASSLPVEMDTVAAAIGEVNTRFHSTGEELERQTTLMVEFADITGGDVVSATDTADKVLKAWGEDSSNLSGLLGMVAQKAQDTGLNAEKLMQNVQENSASFKELGFTLEESINFMAQLDANGVDASTVMAGLKKSVVNLTDAGVSEDEALRQVIDSIKNAATETEALSIAQEIFGTKGAAEMATAIREGRIDLDSLADSMGNYEGVVDNTFSATVDGLDEVQTASNAGKIALAQFGETISGMLAPFIRQLTGILAGATEKLNSMDEGQKRNIVTALLLLAAIGPVISIIGKLTSGIGSLISFSGKLISFGGKIISFAAANPIVLVIAAVAALIAILVTLYNKCEWFRDGVNAVGSAIVSGWNATVSAVQSAASTGLEALRATTQQKLDAVRGAYEINGGGLRGIVAATMVGLQELFTLGLDFIDNLTGGKLSSIESAFSSKLESAKATVSGILDNIKGAFSEKIEAARAAVAQGIENIKNCFNFTWSLPHLALPHFSISGNFSLNPPSVPSFSVAWYKEGGILYGAQLFGMLGKKMLGGGEAGPEAILPLRSFYAELEQIMDKLLGENGGEPRQFNQYNTYNSPRDLSPAECARQTRNETRKLLAAVRRA